MEPVLAALGIFLVLLVVLLFRLAAGGMDKDRIAEYITGKGGRVIDIQWDPFGPGWFGEKNDRIYAVRYKDKNGAEHLAHCKTSMLSGVYLTEDNIERHAPSKAETLEEENQRLRNEIERLKKGKAE